MAAPLISAAKVISALKRSAPKGIEFFDEFPSDMKNVRHGVYVNDPTPQERTPYRLGVQDNAHIYTMIENMIIIQVSFQGDKNKQAVSLAIQGLVEDNLLMDGYHERDYTMDQTYQNRAEYRTYNFDLKRIEFQ
jgi:hypothetical protein